MAKRDYDRALYRLTTILTRLSSGERLRPRELAEEFGVTVRTIQKDLFERLSHIPIERHQDGSYLLGDSYRLPRLPQTDEILILELAAELLDQVHPEFGRTVQRILLCQELPRRNFLLNLGLEELGSHQETFTLLKRTLHSCQRLRFTYTHTGGARREHCADPYRLACLRGRWHLLAWDHHAESITTFHMKSMEQLRAGPDTFTPQPGVEEHIRNLCSKATPYGWIDQGSTSVTLKATGNAHRFLRCALSQNLQKVRETADSLILRLHYREEREVLAFIRHWMPDVTIEDNPHMEARLIRQVEAYLDERSR